MNPIFKNITTYSAKEYKEFLEFHGKKHNLSYFTFTILFTAFLILCSIVQFSSNHTLIGLLFILSLLIFLVYQIIHPLRVVKKEVKSGKISNESKNIFSFFDKSFKVRNKEGISKIKYIRLHKVYETDRFFYLYLNSKNAFIISKNGFTIGNAKEFSRFLKKKIWFKYKN